MPFTNCVSFSIVESKKADDLDFLQDVVSELLAVGKVDEKPILGVIEPLKRETTKSPNITRSIGSIENFFEDIKTQAESYSQSFNEENDHQVSEESEGENEVFSTEGNDSGIEDESMPGVTKESNHKRKSSSRNRKHHDEDGHRSSRRHSDKHGENDRLKRSDSEPKKSKKHGRKHDSDQKNSNTNSLPRPDKYKAKASGDVTIRIDGHDYNSTNIGRNGRTKERRSEPIPTKPNLDAKAKTKTRKSEPILSNTTRNDYEGGLVGNQQRAMTDSHVHKHHKDRSQSPDKKDRSRSKSPGMV